MSRFFGDKIEIREKIQFDYDKATIKPDSFSLMDEITSVITKNPQISRSASRATRGSEGKATHNKQLSADRAKSVMRYLTDHSVAKDRLTAIGFGSEKPIASSSTDAGREQNPACRVRDHRPGREGRRSQ